MGGAHRSLNRGFRALILSAGMLACVGCHKPVATNVLGTYLAEYEDDRDELQLRPDGTYRHVLGTRTLRQVDVGRWMVDTLPRETLGISLDTFRFRTQSGGVKRAGIWHVEVETKAFSGAYELCFDPDLDRCFLKY